MTQSWFQIYCRECGWELEPQAACAMRQGCPYCEASGLWVRTNPGQDRIPLSARSLDEVGWRCEWMTPSQIYAMYCRPMKKESEGV